jgi:putative copper export protein
MALSKQIQDRNQRQQDRAYGIVIFILVLALFVAGVVANKLAVDSVQPVYDEVYGVGQDK